jgi:hypothetical protein
MVYPSVLQLPQNPSQIQSPKVNRKEYACAANATLSSSELISPNVITVCRGEEPILGFCSRKQFIHEAHSSSTFTKLYEVIQLSRVSPARTNCAHLASSWPQAFTRIEGEVESTLGPLEALIPSMELCVSLPLSLTLYPHMETLFSDAVYLSRSPTNLEALDLQKRLSVLFTEYDAIAKRIRAHPVPTPDGSQERVQQAVWTRAVHFMQSHVGILQVWSSVLGACRGPHSL